MAYKDEYEVARLYTDGTFVQAGRRASSTASTCASNSISRRRCSRARDTATGEPRKMTFGPWMLRAFALLAKLKFLRGTPFDPFGYTHERQHRAQADRRLRGDARRDAGASSRPTTTTSRSGSPPSRRRSAASATSRRATSRPPRPTRRRCWSSSAPARRRCSRPPSSSCRRSRCPADGAAQEAIAERHECRLLAWSLPSAWPPAAGS